MMFQEYPMMTAEPKAHAALRRYLKEPVNSLTHMLGAVLSLAGLAVLLVLSWGDPWKVVSFAVYGASGVLLYTASSLLHSINASERTEHALRRLDHAAIFVFIAGCYMPLALIGLRPDYPVWAWVLFGGTWALAAAGVTFKVFWFRAPRWLSTALYLLMGWIALAAVYPLIMVLPPGALLWLMGCGLFYTVGAVFYALRWPLIRPGVFGYHELWHLFVLAGSACHFVLMVVYRLTASGSLLGFEA